MQQDFDAAAGQRRIEVALERLSVAVANVHRDLRSHLASVGSAGMTTVGSAGSVAGSVVAGGGGRGTRPSEYGVGQEALPPSWQRASSSFVEPGSVGGEAGAVHPDAQQPHSSLRDAFSAKARSLSVEMNLHAGHDLHPQEANASQNASQNMSRALSIGLPADWPGSLRHKDFGEGYELDEIEKLPSMGPTNSAGSGDDRKVLARSGLSHAQEPGHQQGFTLVWDADKTSAVQGIAALIGVMVLCHDLTVTPFALAWQLDFVGYMAVSTFCSAVFWTCDILCSLLLGSKCRPGTLWPVLSDVGRKYLTSWCVLDVFLVLGDVVYIVVMSVGKDHPPSEGVRLLRFAKVARMLRIVGLLRALQIVHKMRDVFEQTCNEYLKAALSVTSVLGGILWCTHVLACGWYAIGTYGDSDTGTHWVDTLVLVHDEMIPYRDTSIWFQYLTAAQWALQQMAMAGSMDIMCTNSAERLCNIVSLTLGFMFGSLLISSLSARLVDVMSRQQDKELKMRHLRHYLRSTAVPHKLAGRVLVQVSERLSAQAAVVEESLPALELLSTRLRVELHANICAPMLVTHPLFRLWAAMDATWFTRLCSEVVKVRFLRAGDDLFSSGATATAASVIMMGTVSYSQSDNRTAPSHGAQQEVSVGTWLCESALWCEWVHVGTATAVTSCRVLRLSAAHFQEVCRGHRAIGGLAAAYCKQFHRRLISAKPPVNAWPTDLHVPGTDFAGIVSSMPRGVRTLIGQHALKTYQFGGMYEVVPLLSRNRRSGQEKMRADLLDEVMAGTSTLVVDGTGKLARVVSLILLRVEDGFGRLLVQLGKQEDCTVVANCELPGAKYQEEELVESALHRILSTKLAPFAPYVDLLHIEASSTEKFSSGYGLLTKYLHTVCHAILIGDMEGDVSYLIAQPSASPNSALPSLRSIRTRHSGGTDDSLGPRISGEAKQFASILPASVLTGPVYFIEYQGKGAYYTWLPPNDMDLLQKSHAKAALLEWLMRLETPSACDRVRSGGETEQQHEAEDETLQI